MRAVVAICAAALLAGCVSSAFPYRSGVSPAERAADLAGCEAAALAAYPVDKVTRREPVFYRPGRRVCRDGTCRIVGAGFTGGARRVIDINARSRERAAGQCMAARGYQSVSLPFCTGAVRAALQRNTQQSYPVLRDGSCVVPMGDGTIKVFSP